MIEELAQQMRDYEFAYDMRIPKETWIVLRLDGRGFSSFTEEHFQKPFDAAFHTYMIHTSKALLSSFQGTYAYTGSDEISLLLSPSWEQFDRRVQKLISLSASLVSVAFAQATDFPIQFDSRISTFETLANVCSYFLWRQADVTRCALHTLCYWTLRQEGLSARQVTRQLKNASRQVQEQLLQDRGMVFSDIPLWQQQGIGMHWEIFDKVGFDPIRKVNVIAQRQRMRVEETLPAGKAYKEWLQAIVDVARLEVR